MSSIRLNRLNSRISCLLVYLSIAHLLRVWSLCDSGGTHAAGEKVARRGARSTLKMTSCLVSETTKTAGELTVDNLSTSSTSSFRAGLWTLRQDLTTADSASLARLSTSDGRCSAVDPLRARRTDDDGLPSSSGGRSYTEVLRLESLYPRRSPDIDDDDDDGDPRRLTPPRSALSRSSASDLASPTWLSVAATKFSFSLSSSSSSSSSVQSPLSSMCTHTGTTFPSRRGSRVPASFPVCSSFSFRSPSVGLCQAGVYSPPLFMLVADTPPRFSWSASLVNPCTTGPVSFGYG